MDNLRRPEALLPGDRIAVVAPSSPFPRERFDAGVEWLRGEGFEVVYGEDVFARHHYVAGTAESRVLALEAQLRDPKVKAILFARGGYGSMQMLPLLDWSLFRANPKIVVGYSDGTPLINGLVARGGLVSFHGPVVSGLMSPSDDDSRARLLKVLQGWETPPPALTGGVRIRKGVAEGPCVGGNLSLLSATMGTPWQVNAQGCILCIEDVGERPYALDRMLTQLVLGGVFEGVRGVAFGTFEGCNEGGGRSRPLENLIDEILGELRIPISLGLPYGHGAQNMAFPLGVEAVLDGDRGSLTFQSAAVSEPSPSIGA